MNHLRGHVGGGVVPGQELVGGLAALQGTDTRFGPGSGQVGVGNEGPKRTVGRIELLGNDRFSVVLQFDRHCFIHAFRHLRKGLEEGAGLRVLRYHPINLLGHPCHDDGGLDTIPFDALPEDGLVLLQTRR